MNGAVAPSAAPDDARRGAAPRRRGRAGAPRLDRPMVRGQCRDAADRPVPRADRARVRGRREGDVTSATEARRRPRPTARRARSGARSGALLGAASLVATVANYVFLLVAGRVLGSDDYGALAALLGALTVVLLPTGAVQLAVSREVSRRVASGDASDADAFAWAAFRLVAPRDRARARGRARCSSSRSRALLGDRVDDGGRDWPRPGVAVAFVLPVALGVLQGLPAIRRRSPSSTCCRSPCGSRSSSPIALAGLPARRRRVRRRRRRDRQRSGRGHARSSSPCAAARQRRTTGPAAVPSLPRPGRPRAHRHRGARRTSTSSWRRRASPDEDAGAYAAASAFARVAFFLPATILAVLFPRTAARQARGEETEDILGRSLLVVAGFCGLLVARVRARRAAGSSTPRFGAEFAEAATCSAPFALAMTLYALANVLVGFHLSRGETRYAWLLVAMVPVQIVVLALVPGGLEGLVWANVAVAAAALARSTRSFVGSSVPALRAAGTAPRARLGGHATSRARGRARRSSAAPSSRACSRGRSHATSARRSWARSAPTRAGRSGGSGTSSRRAATTSSARRSHVLTRRAVRLRGVQRPQRPVAPARTTRPTSPRPSSARWRRTTSSSSPGSPSPASPCTRSRATSAARRSSPRGPALAYVIFPAHVARIEHASLLHFEVLALTLLAVAAAAVRPTLLRFGLLARRRARRLAHLGVLRRDGGDRRRARSRSRRQPCGAARRLRASSRAAPRPSWPGRPSSGCCPRPRASRSRPSASGTRSTSRSTASARTSSSCRRRRAPSSASRLERLPRGAQPRRQPLGDRELPRPAHDPARAGVAIVVAWRRRRSEPRLAVAAAGLGAVAIVALALAAPSPVAGFDLDAVPPALGARADDPRPLALDRARDDGAHPARGARAPVRPNVPSSERVAPGRRRLASIGVVARRDGRRRRPSSRAGREQGHADRPGAGGVRRRVEPDARRASWPSTRSSAPTSTTSGSESTGGRSSTARRGARSRTTSSARSSTPTRRGRRSASRSLGVTSIVTRPDSMDFFSTDPPDVPRTDWGPGLRARRRTSTGRRSGA